MQESKLQNYLPVLSRLFIIRKVIKVSLIAPHHKTIRSWISFSHPTVCSRQNDLSDVASASTVVSAVELLLPALLIPLEIALLALLPVTPFVLCEVGSETTNDGAENDIALTMLVAELTASKAANDSTCYADTKATCGRVECVVELSTPALSLLSRSAARARDGARV